MTFDKVAWRELCNCIRTNSVADFIALIDRSPELVQGEGFRGSLLNIASRLGANEIATILINRGSCVNYFEEVGGTPLDCAARYGHVSIASLLLDNGAKLVGEKTTPLLSAIYGDQPEMVKFLIDAGTDPHLVYTMEDGTPITALGYARMYGRPTIEKLLEEMGCTAEVKHTVPETDTTTSKTIEHRRREAIIDYMVTRFGEVDKLTMGDLLPLVDGMSLSIHVIQPSSSNPNLVLFTTGMSDLPLEVIPGQESCRLAELVLQLPGSWPHPRTCNEEEWLWPIEWLRNLAYLPHSSGQPYPHPATIISSADPPEPLGANTKLSCLLLLPDFGLVSQPLQFDDDQEIHFYNVVPIYTEERNFEVRHGLEAFLQKFQQLRNPLLIDLNRPSFAS